MKFQTKSIFAALFIFLAIIMFVTYPAHAADKSSSQQSSLTLKVNIIYPKVFWDCTFLTKDADLGKPAAVYLTWSQGVVPGKEKSQVIVPQGKDSGTVTIATDKDAFLNITVKVVDAKGIRHGFSNIQVINKGQTETITISPPEYSQPDFIWNNG